MIHCPMNYSDSTFPRSSAEGGTPSGRDGQACEDGWELAWELDKGVNLRQGEGKGEGTGGCGTASAQGVAGRTGVVVKRFGERVLETVRKKEEASVRSWRRW